MKLPNQQGSGLLEGALSALMLALAFAGLVRLGLSAQREQNAQLRAGTDGWMFAAGLPVSSGTQTERGNLGTRATYSHALTDQTHEHRSVTLDLLATPR